MRPATKSDDTSIRKLLENHNVTTEELATEQLIGFLVGTPAAVAGVSFSPSEAEIQYLVVRPDLRKKRVGRVMIGELAALARQRGASRLVLRKRTPFDEAFRRLGFVESGETLVLSLE
ncbi:MAG TPA: GNAT family N-acetyltransferase [Thermoanaerobaculia bacterium]|nr:GNAT family N-acetyltransferase [Thermoanaerobaculia bacterium]